MLARRILLLCAVVLLSGPSFSFAQDAKGPAFASKGLKGAPTKAAPATCDAPAKDPALWDKNGTVGFNYTSGNSNVTGLNLNPQASRDFEGEAWRLEAEYNYGNASDGPNTPRETTKNNFRTWVEYKHTVDDSLYVGSNTNFAWDQIADLNYRVVLNPVSVGSYVVKDDEKTISVDVGPAYVWENIGGETNDFAAARFANRLEWAISSTASFFQGAEYVISFEDSSNYIFNAEAGLQTAITSSVDLLLLVRDYYLNKPAPDRNPNDVMTITGLKMKF